MSNDLFYQETPRLILRSPIDSDPEALAQGRSTDFVTRYNLYQPCDAQQIRRELELYEHMVITLKGDGRVIGCVSIREDDTRYHMDSKTLHAWLVEEMAYQGYMAEVLAVVLDRLFVREGHERVAVQILSENRASIRLAEKVGFEREGYLKRALRNSRDQIFDVVLYSMDREAYLRQKQ